MQKIIGSLFLGVALTTLLACTAGEESEQAERVPGRWYAQAQVEQGRGLYEQHCQSCHGAEGRSVREWRTPLADGAYPPPPLNGTAHTWHHPMRMLLETIKQGGIARGGKMPAFADRLNDAEQRAVLAYVQSLWSEAIYTTWAERVNKE